ncbi:bacterial transferase hexapeptide repeat protein [Trichinella nativa]|uniref:Dynactin subunit 6 n=1 Tax=Trichinella nativa TaxID=6335 RepID=A0A1Y3EV75_9BILA|nr:bacterial transferase hexapeptide repeat protein [Trichinella nativa]
MSNEDIPGSKKSTPAKDCFVPINAIIQGDVKIGPGTVVASRVEIRAEEGPIVIGEDNIFEVSASIINRHKGLTMTIGNNNVFGIQSHCEALKVGDNNLLEVKAHVGPNVEITDHCIVGVGVSLKTSEVISPKTAVVFSTPPLRHVAIEPMNSELMGPDYLRETIEKYYPRNEQFK